MYDSGISNVIKIFPSLELDRGFYQKSYYIQSSDYYYIIDKTQTPFVFCLMSNDHNMQLLLPNNDHWLVIPKILYSNISVGQTPEPLIMLFCPLV